MEKQGLLKQAAQAIRTLWTENKSLQSEVSELKNELEKQAKARELAFTLMKKGAFPLEDFEDRLNDFNNKSKEELQTFEKAAEFMKVGTFHLDDLGSLSDMPESGNTPEERFFNSLLEM